MSSITETRSLAPGVQAIKIVAPKIARHRLPGQFVIVRATPDGERIPLTIADADPEAGTITLVVQAVGKTTTLLAALEAGAEILDLVGPLGTPSEVAEFGTVVVVGGGVGTAVSYPTAMALSRLGNTVIAVIGARNQSGLLFEHELRAICDEVYPCTEDGSHGRQGLVTDALSDLLSTRSVDRVLAAGPIPMMKAVAEATRPHGVPTIASLNPIMIDGTGMCGGCRVSVGGATRFACIDGPEFDAHAVDFDLLDKRNRTYVDWEKRQMDALAPCVIADPGRTGEQS